MAVAVGDGVGGVIAAWMDQRFGSSTTRPQYCIFAQLINRTGVLGGSLLTTAGERRTVPAESFRLFQNYPNPFNPSTTVEYDLPSQSKVVVQIYDILGRLVDEVKNEIEPAGHIRLRWNPQNRFASGVYFCRVEVTPIDRGRGVQSAVLKMLLIR
jgi:hypothetical protein